MEADKIAEDIENRIKTLIRVNGSVCWIYMMKMLIYLHYWDRKFC